MLYYSFLMNGYGGNGGIDLNDFFMVGNFGLFFQNNNFFGGYINMNNVLNGFFGDDELFDSFISFNLIDYQGGLYG